MQQDLKEEKPKPPQQILNDLIVNAFGLLCALSITLSLRPVVE
jgi:hypothetical protein